MTIERHFPTSRFDTMRYQVLEPIADRLKLLGHGPTRSAAWSMAGIDPNKLPTPPMPVECLPVEPAPVVRKCVAARKKPSQYGEALADLKAMPVGSTILREYHRRACYLMAAKRNGMRIYTKKVDGGFTEITRNK